MSPPVLPDLPPDGRRPLIVVLGASGFIGSAVTAALAELPVQLRLVARRPGVTPAEPVADVEVQSRDLSLPREVARTVAGADAVLHLAAHIGGDQSWRAADERSEQINLGVMRELLRTLGEAAPDGPAPVMVFAGTLQAGAGRSQAVGAYAAQKLAAERLLHQADAEGTVRGTVLRLCTVFGRSPLTGSTGRGVLAAMAGRALAGETLTMWHDGSVERDFLDVRDAAAAFVTALRHADDLRGGSWVVGTGRTHRLDAVFGGVARAVAEHTGERPVPLVTVDPPDHAESADFHTPDSDPSAFRAVTGWQPRRELKDGIAAVITALDKARPRPEPAGAPEGGTE